MSLLHKPCTIIGMKNLYYSRDGKSLLMHIYFSGFFFVYLRFFRERERGKYTYIYSLYRDASFECKFVLFFLWNFFGSHWMQKLKKLKWDNIHILLYKVGTHFEILLQILSPMTFFVQLFKSLGYFGGQNIALNGKSFFFFKNMLFSSL